MSTSKHDTEPMVLRIANAVARYFGFGDLDVPAYTSITRPLKIEIAEPMPQRTLHLVKREEPAFTLPGEPAESRRSARQEDESTANHPVLKWRRHPQLRKHTPRLSPEVREARAAAVSGLYAASEGALDAATRKFVEAARCEEIDLTAVPGFWNLTRGQMQCAVKAYEIVHRYRDSAALDAHISTIFRPSLVGVDIQPISPAMSENKAVGN